MIDMLAEIVPHFLRNIARVFTVLQDISKTSHTHTQEACVVVAGVLWWMHTNKVRRKAQRAIMQTSAETPRQLKPERTISRSAPTH
jgi:hypothetical protein